MSKSKVGDEFGAKISISVATCEGDCAASVARARPRCTVEKRMTSAPTILRYEVSKDLLQIKRNGNILITVSYGDLQRKVFNDYNKAGYKTLFNIF